MMDKDFQFEKTEYPHFVPYVRVSAEKPFLSTLNSLTYAEARQFFDFLYDLLAEDNSMEWRTKDSFCERIMQAAAGAVEKNDG